MNTDQLNREVAAVRCLNLARFGSDQSKSLPDEIVQYIMGYISHARRYHDRMVRHMATVWDYHNRLRVSSWYFKRGVPKFPPTSYKIVRRYHRCKQCKSLEFGVYLPKNKICIECQMENDGYYN